jgi:hypothetical protein
MSNSRGNNLNVFFCRDNPAFEIPNVGIAQTLGEYQCFPICWAVSSKFEHQNLNVVEFDSKAISTSKLLPAFMIRA